LFIHCFDKDLKEELIKNGFKLLYENNNKATFILDKNIKFNFNEIDKTKYLINSKMIF